MKKKLFSKGHITIVVKTLLTKVAHPFKIMPEDSQYNILKAALS